MSYQLVTPSTEPQTADLDEWRQRYRAAKSIDAGHRILRSPPKQSRIEAEREGAIRESIELHAKQHGLDQDESNWCVAMAVSKFHKTKSAAAAIADGWNAVGNIAWGLNDNGPEAAA